MNNRAIDMSGKKYSRLTAIEPVRRLANRNIAWSFLCSCGNHCVKDGYSVRSGKTTSCPSCATERTRLALVKHGMTNTPEYSAWSDIKTRCHNSNRPEYPRYGGRGIKVCDRWLESFDVFLADMGPRLSNQHSIDRINNNGNYEPGNCRWATNKEQVRNRRNTVKITIDGNCKSLAEWCEEYNCSLAAARYRRKKGLTGEAIFLSQVKTISFNGIVDTFSGWSKRTGIKPNTISMRVNKYNWPIGKALTIGAKL